MSDEQVKAQGIMDSFFLDKEMIDHIKKIVMAIDPKKVKAILDHIDTDGGLHVNIDVSFK